MCGVLSMLCVLFYVWHHTIVVTTPTPAVTSPIVSPRIHLYPHPSPPTHILIHHLPPHMFTSTSTPFVPRPHPNPSLHPTFATPLTTHPATFMHSTHYNPHPHPSLPTLLSPKLTQRVKQLLAEGIKPDDPKDNVSLCCAYVVTCCHLYRRVISPMYTTRCPPTCGRFHRLLCVHLHLYSRIGQPWYRLLLTARLPAWRRSSRPRRTLTVGTM